MVSFLGAGPNEATRPVRRREAFEGPQIMGVAANIEEWAHEEYFVTQPGNPGRRRRPERGRHGRAEEILSEMEFIGANAHRDLRPGTQAPGPPAAAWRANCRRSSHPLLCALPLSLLGFYLAEALGKRSYNFGSEEIRVEHYDTIHRATIGEPA